MGLKTAGVGHFTIPTAPAAGTSCTSGAANAFTTTYVQLIASTSAALYITGVHLESAAALAATYIILQLATGGAGSETVIGQYLVPLSTGSTVALGYRQIYPPIPVATTTRIACKTADSVGAKATLVTLECIAQSNVVDDGVTVGTVNLVNTLTTYTGNTPQTGDSFARLGAPAGASHSADVAAVKTDTAAVKIQTDKLTFTVAGYLDVNAYKWVGGTIPAVAVTGVPLVDLKYVLGTISPATAGSVRADAVTGAVGSVTGAVGSVTGNVGGNVVGSVASVTARVTANADQLAGQTVTAAAGVTFPTSVASPTNITAGTITTVTNLTNAPTAGDLTATMKASVTTAATAATPTAAAVTGSVGSVVGLTVANLDATISSRASAANLATLSTTLGTPAGISVSADVAAVKADTAAVKTATDQLAFTAGSVNTNIKAINGTVVTGSGTAIAPWGP
jgi:hypothetical protein